MQQIVSGFHVKQYKVAVVHHLACIVSPHGTAGINGCMQSSLLAKAQVLAYEASLQERFTAAYGHSALANEILVFQRLREQFVG